MNTYRTEPLTENLDGEYVIIDEQSGEQIAVATDQSTADLIATALYYWTNEE